MNSIRIAYFIDHLKVGGAQRHLVEVLRHLDRERFTTQVWTLRGEGELIAEVEGLGIPTQSFGLGKRLVELRSLPLFIRAARCLRQERIQIVHCYLSFANVVGMLSAALARTPVRLVSKRSLDIYKRRSEAWGHWAVNRAADRVVANAQAVKQFVIQHEGCQTEKIVVIPNGLVASFLSGRNGIDKRATLGLAPDTYVVGTVGRLTWKKGQEYLLQAAALVLRQQPQMAFVLVGDGPLRKRLEEQARALGIESQVKFLGQRLDTQDLIPLFDVFVLPSVIEGMPNVLLEALALERPVVVTNVGGNSEIVTHEKTGLVVSAREPEDLAAALLRLMNDRVLAQRLGAAGRQDVAGRFSFLRTLEAMESLYKELLKTKGIGG